MTWNLIYFCLPRIIKHCIDLQLVYRIPADTWHGVTMIATTIAQTESRRPDRSATDAVDGAAVAHRTASARLGRHRHRGRRLCRVVCYHFCFYVAVSLIKIFARALTSRAHTKNLCAISICVYIYRSPQRTCAIALYAVDGDAPIIIIVDHSPHISCYCTYKAGR